MNFTSFAELKGPFPSYEDDAYNYYDHLLDNVRPLMDKSDLVKITLFDGSTQLLTKVNFNLGQCDCCRDVDPQAIVKYEFFKKDHS